MKTKEAVSTKKQRVALKDLKTKKNPKGGANAVEYGLITAMIAKKGQPGQRGCNWK